jgi:glucokinase
MIRIRQLLMLFMLFNFFPVLASAQEQQPPTWIVGGTVGGEQVEIGLFKASGARLELIERSIQETKTLPTQNSFNTFFKNKVEELRKKYETTDEYISLAVSGPTQPNQDWILSSHMSYPVDGKEIQKNTGALKVLVINNFEMSAYGLPFLKSDAVEELYKGVPQQEKPRALIGAGGGLGNCLLVPCGNSSCVLPTGLNMTAFTPTPTDKKEVQFFEFLQKKQPASEPHVGWGTALGSKGGLTAIYRCFYDKSSTLSAQEIFVKARKANADDTHYSQYVDAVTMYMHLYARAIRNFMLLTLPYAGVYITNRVAQDNPELIRSKKFIRDIQTSGNGVLDEMLQQIPIYLITDDSLMLYGAAARAMQEVR